MLALLAVVGCWRRERPRRLHGVLRQCSRRPGSFDARGITTTLILWLGHWSNGVDSHPGPAEQLADQPDPLAPSQPVLHGADSAGTLAGLVYRRSPGDLCPGCSSRARPSHLGPRKLAASRPRGLLDGIGGLGIGRLGVALRLADALRVATSAFAALRQAIWRPVDQVPSPIPPTGCTSRSFRSFGSFRRASSWSRFPSPVKFLLALAIGLAWSLLTYEACVRRTWIGRWLRGGRRASPLSS